MALVKICPSCGYENNSGEIVCDKCMADISGVIPVDRSSEVTKVRKTVRESQVNVDSSSTVIERRRDIKFVATDGSGSFSVCSGMVIGREADGREYLASHMTVSRRHARVSYNGIWSIEDINSSNGTYVNERRLESGEKAEIKSGDRVSLSRSCTFNITE